MPLTDKASSRTASVGRLLLAIVATLALSALPLVVFVVPKVMRVKTVQGVAASYDLLTRRKELRLLADALPSTSRDVAYWVQPYCRIAFASFPLDAEDYLTWAKQRGWDPRRIGEDEAVGAYVVQPYAAASMARKYVLVRHGYCYEHEAGKRRSKTDYEYDWEVKAVYDADEGMAYYSFITPD